ncbi:MAG: DUF4224 domain-containing protein [Sedimenticola sp.]
MFLSKDELKELTGYSRPSSHRWWLVDNGYPFEVGADGYPRVMVACVTQRLGANAEPRSRKVAKPNFAVLLR